MTARRLNLKISSKLTLAFGVVVATVAVSNGFVFMSNRAVDAANLQAEESRQLLAAGEKVLAASVVMQDRKQAMVY